MSDPRLKAEYAPTFFTQHEWAFILAACDVLIPADAVGPGAIELCVPEFLDRHMQTPYAAGASWYRDGPFLKAPPEFGYQGRLALREIIRTGIGAVDRFCRDSFDGLRFAELNEQGRTSVLESLERDEIELGEVSSGVFFAFFLAEVRCGYFSDPIHGGNRNMGSWKMIGYPGQQEDYRGWIGVRNDGCLPLVPVSLATRKR